MVNLSSSHSRDGSNREEKRVMPVLTGIDILGIQDYVFASNRLRDVISASWLVHWATAKDGALAQAGLEEGAEVVLASGGNAILSFQDQTRARDFVTRYSRLLYDKAPGLEVAVVHHCFEPGGLADAMHKLQLDLSVAKLERMPSVPQLGISVTAACQITGLPAVGFDPSERNVPLSAVVMRWRDAGVREEANMRWQYFLDDEAGKGQYAFPAELDKMGRTPGERSLVGVVHVDGNGVGEAIRKWLNKCIQDNVPDDKVRQQLREWSESVDRVGREALERAIKRTIEAVAQKNGEYELVGEIEDLSFGLECSDGQVFLPLRPVLLGGDDLTFLCDGRIALDLAETALAAFECCVRHLGKLSACAGVAIVPVHAPFERAYALAESLCRNAKRRRREEGDSGSWLDWHIGAPLPGETVNDLRLRKYSFWAGQTTLELTCRPYRLGAGADDEQSWRWLSHTVLGTEDRGFRGELWNAHRNKLKELAVRVREGPEGIRRMRESWTAARSFPWPKGLDKNDGFFDAVRTPLVDALELLDLYLPLGREGDDEQ